MHRKLYYVHVYMCQAPIAFKIKIQTLQTYFLYSLIWSLLPYMPPATQELALQIFVVQWKYQTHEHQKELNYVMAHGLPDGYIK